MNAESRHTVSMVTAVREFINQHDLFAECRRLLLAVSGGADSMALLDLLTGLANQKSIPPIGLCVHINHQLRGTQSDADECLVQQQTLQRGIPFIACPVDVRAHAKIHQQSLETAGRELRFQQLERLAREHRCDAIVTAHHMDDNAETLVHRLLRGTGWRGLAGIRPQRRLTHSVCLVRPLLGLRRRDILDYLTAHGIPWREDQSNRDCRFTRNQIRHGLLPRLQKQTRIDLIAELGELASRINHWQMNYHPRVKALWLQHIQPSSSDEPVNLPLRMLASQPPWIQLDLFRLSLRHLGAGERNLTHWHYQRLLTMASNSRSRQIVILPGAIRAERTSHHLCLHPGTDQTPVQASFNTQELRIPGITQVGPFRIKASIRDSQPHGFDQKNRHMEWMDTDRLHLPLCARMRAEGDRFTPLGKHTPQKVGKFLTHAKAQGSILIVEDQERIVWVAPVRLSEEVKIGPATKRVIQLELL